MSEMLTVAEIDAARERPFDIVPTEYFRRCERMARALAVLEESAKVGMLRHPLESRFHEDANERRLATVETAHDCAYGHGATFLDAIEAADAAMRPAP